MKKRRVASVRNMSKEDKRRLQLNKRLDKNTIEEKRAKFARPTDSKLFVKTNGSEAVRTPLNRRLIAIILAIVMVVGLIPAGIFMLRPKAADNGLGPVEMSVRVNGADNFTTAIVPGGEISKTIEEAEYALSLPDDILFQKAVIIDTSDNTETEIFSAGSLNNKTYYSFDKNSSAGTLMDTETQHMVLVLAEKHPLTLNYDASKGEAVTTASTEGSSTFVWGGESLRVQATPKMDYVLGSVTYTVGNTSRAATVVNNAATIPAREITGPISVSVNFQKISSYNIEEVEEMDNSLFYPDLDKPNNISNHGNIADGPDDSLVPTRDNADSIAPGENASFFLHSQSSSGGSHFELVNLSINGINIDYPTETNDPKPTTYHDGDYTSIVTVELLNKDTRLSYLGDGSEKHRALYKIDITNIHENLEVNFYFKESTDRNVILKGLKGVKNTGFSEEHDVSLSSNYFYTLNQTKINVYTAAYINSTNNPSANLAVYTVKPGYNPSSAVYELSRDNGPKSSTGIRNNGRIGNPEAIIDNAGGIFDDSTRYWGKNSGSLSNSEERYGASLFSSGTELMLTTLDRLGDSWYGVALTQHSSNNQQLYINLAPYNYFLRLDLGEGGAMEGYTDRFDKSGNTLTEKSTLGHTVEDRQAYITLPAETPTNSNTQVIFAGWRLIDKNGNPVKSNGNDVIYQNLGQIALSGVNLTAAYGKNTTSAEEADQVISLEAIWEDVNTADVTTIEVNTWAEVPEGTSGAVSKDLTVDGETVTKYYLRVKNHRETQPVDRETIMINMPAPDYDQYYKLDTTLSKLSATTRHQTSLDQVPENNVYDLYYNIAYKDLTVTKQVQGNPTQLSEGFEITTTITRPEGAPLTTAEALDGIVFSNGDKANAQVTATTITYTKAYGRSEKVNLSNVPQGWTVTVSEPKAAAPEAGSNPDYTTTITSKPEDVGSQVAEDDGYTGPTRWTGVLEKNTTVTVTNKSESYLVMDKNISRNKYGKYDLTMEAYATGDVTSETRTEKIPTDFVVIVDQSGSMAQKDMAIDPVRANRTVTLEEANSGQYYYKVTDDSGDEPVDRYYRVYGKKGNLYQYYAPNSKWVEDVVKESGMGLSWFQSEKQGNFDVANQYYYRLGSKNYTPITVTVSGEFLRYYVKFRYKDNNGTTQFFHYPDKPYYKPFVTAGILNVRDPYTDGQTLYDTANGLVKRVFSEDDTCYTYAKVTLIPGTWFTDEVAIKTGMYIDQPMYKRHIGYTGLYYRDINGVEHPVTSTSGLNDTEYCNADKQALTNNTGNSRMEYDDLYVPSDTQRRRDSLEDALNAFAQKVANETDDVNGLVDNKIAIVGFSSNGYNNTEVLTSSQNAISWSDTGYSSNNTNMYFPYTGANYAAATTSGLSSNGTNYNGTQKASAGTTTYQNALVNAAQGMADVEGEDNPVNQSLAKSIKSITAYGGTQPEDGFEMAYEILNNRTAENKVYKKADGTTVDRNTVVIYFTDGRPGDFNYSDQYKEANDVIKQAARVKGLTNPNGSKPIVFSIGVFDESDGNPLTYSKYYSTSTSSSAKPSENRNQDNTGMRHTDSDLEYDLTWVDTDSTSNSGWYYYLNREWDSTDTAKYGDTANDTIFDYMSVVSSNYPTATGFTSDEWISGNESRTWKEMTVGSNSVRGLQIVDENQSPVNKYYRMASNQQTLLDTFEQIATSTLSEITTATTGMDGKSAFLRDEINGNDFVIPEDPASSLTVKVYTQIGEQKRKPSGNEPATKYIEFPNDWVEITADMSEEDAAAWYEEHVTWSTDGTNAYVDVTGFDYGANFIANEKPKNDTEGTDVDEGKKLIVVVSGLEPKETSTGDLTSNTTDSGIYKLVYSQDSEEPEEQLMNGFPVPHLYRYGYTLRETSDSVPPKTDDTFKVTFAKGGEYTGTDGVMVTYDDHDRQTPTALGTSYTWNDAEDGNAIYFETFDKNAVLSASVPNAGLDEEKYEYSLYRVDSSGAEEQDFNSAFDLEESSSTIHVHNTTNTRTVVIKESTLGVEGQADYSSKSKKFPIQLKLTKADGETLVSEPISATIIRKDNPDDPKSVTLDFHQNEGVVEIELADGDTITFDTLKNYKLTVWEETDDHDGYTDSYRPDNNAAEIGSGVVVIDDDNDNNVVEVINRLNANPDVESGILDSNNPSKILFAVLGIIAILGAAGAGIFLWKKRNGFVEE